MPPIKADNHRCGGPMHGVSHVRYCAGGGRTPRDPHTGKTPPPGSYGPWKKCRQCEIWLIYPGRFCPCCSIILSTKPRHACADRNRRMAEARREARRLEEAMTA